MVEEYFLTNTKYLPISFPEKPIEELKYEPPFVVCDCL